MKSAVVAVVFFAFGCGHEPNPVADTLVTQAGPGLEGDPQITEWPLAFQDAGTDAGEAVDAGEPVAGSDPTPWSNCIRHKHAQGHGVGLYKSCED